ncbi:hypothetical protein N7603_04320 [Acholeplasma vituli]|uniref:Uncharacterized protein n=1 Tax=Paracholeplasma vituli TaxID=69473 RepID=A0ABT2PV98_9MOLU|nr:hypothetical protein [Paracholeplasma vituli]MCU0104876.1 hypothetical protein [Paracholeplasma vituli]
MNLNVFNKMRIKKGTIGRHFYAPESYINMVKDQDIIDFEGDNPTFYHLFVASQQDFIERITPIMETMNTDTRLWVSYPKKLRYESYDINRDTLFELGTEYGIKPYANVALNEEWSCVGMKLK